MSGWFLEFGFWAKSYVAASKHDLAFRELGKAVENSRGSAWTRCMLGHAWGQFGEPAKAREILVDLQDSDKHGYVRAFGVAIIYLGLGDRDQALTWLEKGCNDCDVWALMLKVDPIYELAVLLDLGSNFFASESAIPDPSQTQVAGNSSLLLAIVAACLCSGGSAWSCGDGLVPVPHSVCLVRNRKLQR